MVGRPTRTCVGSSPLTRGALRSQVSNIPPDRLIPAHAGSTEFFAAAGAASSAHPRSRGEHVRQAHPARPRRGSSPLTRGARGRVDEEGVLARLIPAHAGSTAFPRGAAAITAAHPRSRGEHLLVEAECFSACGSSPLTRGAQSSALRREYRIRLIPAHAGSTDRIPGQGHESAAHPRSRGEHIIAWAFTTGVPGSSPLTRGALGEACEAARFVRLIPAHAGSTCSSALAAARSPAHPRSRGEHFEATKPTPDPRGSSPLTRGARSSRLLPPVVPRLIPAHAGSTSSYQ